MTFTTSPADRKDGGGGGLLFPRKDGQVRPVTFQFFLRWLTFGGGGKTQGSSCAPAPLSYELRRGGKGLSDKQSQQP